jgi:NAD(P)-dependent dehydrogenase (short-subunit alcohol dehydrogenase family)
MGKMDGKVALVAGNLGKIKDGAFKSGLGALIAKDLADEGAKVIVLDLDVADAEACAKSLNSPNIKAKACDLLKDRTFETKKFTNERGEEKTEIVWTDNPALKLVEQIADEFGKLDALVTNFDYVEKGRLENMTDDEYKNMYKFNIKPVFHLLAGVRDQFSAQNKKDGSLAKVVMMTNMLGKGGASTVTVYCGFKAAIVHGVKTVCREFGKFAYVNSVAMAPLSSKGAQGPSDRLKKQFFFTSGPMANIDINFEHIVPVVRLLCSEESNGISGQCISVDGGLWLHAEL